MTITPGAEEDPLVDGIEDFDANDELYLCEYHGEAGLLRDPLDGRHARLGGGVVMTTPEDSRAWSCTAAPWSRGCVLYLTLGH